MVEGYQRLTEKEKQTLRLLLLGHDAKSSARHLGLSVHTINERLRDARRKLSVSSSKEAARLLLQAEQPESVGYALLGDAGGTPARKDGGASTPPRRYRRGAAWALGGTAMLSIVAAALVLSAPVDAPLPGHDPTAVSVPVAATPASAAARRFLELIDDARWNESWAATARSFQAVNSVITWQAASEKARGPLGRLVSRTLLSDDFTPAPPNGYQTVRFREDFANKHDMIETVALDREADGAWKVVGIVIE